MPWSQMTSMNIKPPRLSEARKLATLPALKARMRNRVSRNMGCATLVSTTPKTTRMPMPPKMAATTKGFVHTIVCPP